MAHPIFGTLRLRGQGTKVPARRALERPALLRGVSAVLAADQRRSGAAEGGRDAGAAAPAGEAFGQNDGPRKNGILISNWGDISAGPRGALATGSGAGNSEAGGQGAVGISGAGAELPRS